MSKYQQQIFHLFLATLVLCVGLLVGCQTKRPQVIATAPTADGPAERQPAPVATVLAMGGESMPVVSAATRGALASSESKTLLAEDEKNDEPKDYWASIPFSFANFIEVREFVREYYIDSKIDESRAYVEAANQVLYQLEEPRELLPLDFYKKRKNHPDEEDGLKGKTYKLSPRDAFLVHVIPKPDEKKKRKKLSDDEIRDLRKKALARRQFLQTAWAKNTYDEALLDRVMDHVAERLNEDYKKSKKKDKEKPSLKKFYVAAAQGFLWSLDPHSSLVSKEAWEESTRKTEDSSFEGIGAILMTRDDATVVESPLSGRPAEKAGLRAGDVIVKVDGKDITGLPLIKVVKRIRGPKGEAVVLTIQRESEPEEFDIRIVRAHIEIKNVSGRLLGHHKDIGYIKLTGFIPTSTDNVRRMYADLSAQSTTGELRGLVFDLRNNSGGLLSQGIDIADLFLKRGRIVSVRSRNRGDEPSDARRRPYWDVPLVVLVNDGSASASEIVASAIQDNKRGLIVGDRTFGKASVQQLMDPIPHVVERKYWIKLTVARYYSPSGRTIQVVGVNPDISVAPEASGEFPLGYREEDLSNYLKPINADYRSPNQTLATKVEKCGKKRGIADQIQAADPNPQIKFDYQLMKAADFLECAIDIKAPSATTTAHE